MKVISMTIGKSGPEIIMALGTWAGTELGGLEQLQSADDAMTQLKDNFTLDDAEVEKAQPDSTGKTADTETADKVDSAAAVADSSEVLAISKEPAEVAMSDDKLEEFFQGLKSDTDAQPAMRHQLVSYMLARGCVDRMAATSACGLDHPAAAAPLTQRQDGLNNSLVRLVSFVENPLARRAKPAKAADCISDAADQPAPFVKPKPKSKKHTLTQELADRVGNKENDSSASNSQPAQVVADAATHCQPVQVAVDAAAKPVPAKRWLPRCMECKACLTRLTGKQACEKNKAQRLAEQSSTIAA